MTIRNALYKLRSTLAPAEIISLDKPFIRKMQVELERGGALLAGLRRAMKMQWKRIEQARKTEKDLPVTLQQLTADMELYRRLEETHLSLAQQLGLTRGVPPRPDAQGAGLYGEVAKLPTESRQRVLEAAKRLVALGKAKPALPPADPGTAPGEGR